MIYSLNGERCTSSSRLLVQRRSTTSSSPRWPSGCARCRVGHPLDPATEIGPLIHPRHCDKVRSYPTTAASDGATVVVGGGDPRRPRRQLRQPDAVHRCRQRHAHRPGGDLRAGAHRHPVRRRGRSGRDRQRLRLRPRRLRVDRRHRPRPSGRPRPRRRHGLGQLAERPPPADAVRRHQGAAASAATAATTRSSSTWRPRTSPSPTAPTRSRNWAAEHIGGTDMQAIDHEANRGVAPRRDHAHAHLGPDRLGADLPCSGRVPDRTGRGCCAAQFPASAESRRPSAGNRGEPPCGCGRRASARARNGLRRRVRIHLPLRRRGRPPHPQGTLPRRGGRVRTPLEGQRRFPGRRHISRLTQTRAASPLRGSAAGTGGSAPRSRHGAPPLRDRAG